MRAVVMRDRSLVVDSFPDPKPGPGEVLVRTLACGICGSDLHALRHADRMVEAVREGGGPTFMDPHRDVVMGHEFCAEIVDYGSDTQRTIPSGRRVVSMPVLFRTTGMEPVGYSNDVPGGYGELMLLSEMLLLEVPNGLDTGTAALTEPMAVGVHAVNKAQVGKDDAPLVVGCGPVGLAVIAALRRQGVRPVVASDYSPMRRGLAEAMGADVVVDPAERSVIATWAQAAGMRNPVIFECVGVPGLLHGIMCEAPPGTRIVVVGACMEDDRIKPIIGINKELAFQFVLGYTPEEFAASLQSIAEGEIDPSVLVTGKVGLEGVAGAFETLAKPDEHAKILVEP